MIAPRRPTPSARAAPAAPSQLFAGALLVAAVLLSGCQGGLQPPSRLAQAAGFAPSDPALRQRLSPDGSTASPIIATLAGRRSLLPPNGSFARIAMAVQANSPGVEPAELGLARLRAEAASRNIWPSATPALTLTSLSGLAAQLVIDQPLMDHGRRKAERDRAAAELDLAAVTLSTRQNARAFEGLSLYLRAEQSRSQAEIARRATARLGEFHAIVTARIAGGLSDRTEEQIIAQSLAEMQATLAGDEEARRQALADLAALTGHDLPDAITGLDPLPEVPMADTLSVLQAEAEGARRLAEARITRASALPGLSANATISEDGATPGLSLGGIRLGLGSPAVVQAAEATPALVARQRAEARQTADRRRIEFQGRIAQLRTRQAQGQAVLRQTLGNLDLYAEQYRIGRRSLTELTAQTAAAARLERDQAALVYEIARLQLELARDAGALIDGAAL